MQAKYTTNNETAHFNFYESYIAEMKQMNGYFYAVLDNVTILPENSCNRDIREMRANNLTLTLREGRITDFIQEGYKVYNANGVVTEQVEDTAIDPEQYNEVLKSFSESMIYAIEKKEQGYVFSIDTEAHTYLFTVEASEDVEEWDRFLNKA